LNLRELFEKRFGSLPNRLLLESIMVGNFSNKGWLMLGNGGNGDGCYYDLGLVQFFARYNEGGE